MLFLKSFFRKKSTIIYLIIYSVILTTIISIYSLIKYNQNVMNDIYKQKSFIALTCTGDYYEEILKSKNVEGVDRIILFKANDNNTVFKRQSYTIISKDTIVDYDNGEKADEVVTWGDYMWMIHNAIIISSDKDKDFKLQDDEIALTSGGDESATRTTEAINLIGVLEPMGFVIICVFVIIFVVVSKNILSDEKKNSNIERLLGYNKKQVKRHTMLKVVALSIISLTIAIVLSIILMLCLKSVY